MDSKSTCKSLYKDTASLILPFDRGNVSLQREFSVETTERMNKVSVENCRELFQIKAIGTCKGTEPSFSHQWSSEGRPGTLLASPAEPLPLPRRQKAHSKVPREKTSRPMMRTPPLTHTYLRMCKSWLRLLGRRWRIKDDVTVLYELQNDESPLTASLLTTGLKKENCRALEIYGLDSYAKIFLTVLLSHPFSPTVHDPRERNTQLISLFVHFSGREKASLLTASMLSEVRTNVEGWEVR